MAQYRSDGTQAWSRQLGSKGDELSRAMAVDKDGSVYIAGWSTRRLSGWYGGAHDGFLAKYDTTGTRWWVRDVGTGGDDYALSVAVDGLGGVFVGGSTSGAFPGFANQGGTDGFIARYTSGGSASWVTQAGTSGQDLVYGLAADGSGHLYAAGSTSGGLLGASQGGDDAFIARYLTASGQREAWGGQVGTSGEDRARAVTWSGADSTPRAVVVGTTAGALYGSAAGGRDVWLAQYSG